MERGIKKTLCSAPQVPCRQLEENPEGMAETEPPCLWPWSPCPKAGKALQCLGLVLPTATGKKRCILPHWHLKGDGWPGAVSRLLPLDGRGAPSSAAGRPMRPLSVSCELPLSVMLATVQSHR